MQVTEFFRPFDIRVGLVLNHIRVGLMHHSAVKEAYYIFFQVFYFVQYIKFVSNPLHIQVILGTISDASYTNFKVLQYKILYVQ